MWEFIDHFVFINLDHRTDRLPIIQDFLKKGNIPPEKVTRFPAIRYTPGNMGCSKSHIGVMNLIKQKGWKNTLVLEDDVEWNDFETNYKKLEEAMKKPYNVLLLGGDFIEVKEDRILKAHGTYSYIVPLRYVDTLLQNFEEGLNYHSIIKFQNSFLRKDPIKAVKKANLYNIDVYWWTLQVRDNWIGMIPAMVNHVDTHSDTKN